MINNHITTSPDLSVWDVGSRTLTGKEIGYLQRTIRPIYDSILSYKLMWEAFTEIAIMFKMEDIKFECLYKTFEYCFKSFLNQENKNKIKEILETTYKKPLPEKNIQSLADILYKDPEAHFNLKDARKIEEDIYSIILQEPFENMVVVSASTDTQFINNTYSKQIIKRRLKEVNGKDYSTDTIILNACLKDLIVYKNPLDEDPRQFKATFEILEDERPLTIGPMILPDISDFLVESGYVLANQLIKDALPAIFNGFVKEKKAKIETEIEYPGFFYDVKEKTITNIKYDIKEPGKDDLRMALEVLEDFVTYFPGVESKVAHILKWGLISPFSFVMKQKGQWLPWVLLHGSAGSGKTTIGDLILYLWGVPDSNTNDLGGASFNTEARIGEKLKQSTFPLVVNEPGGVFNKPHLVEMIKTSVERVNSRGRFEGRRYKNVLSLSSVIFTSNQLPPKDDAIIRRLETISFTYNERKSEDQKQKFNNQFKIMNRESCKLHMLKPLANYFTMEIIEDPSLLNGSWKELTNKLLVRIYVEVGKVTPEWLLSWSEIETLEDIDDLIIGQVRVFVLQLINRAYGLVKVYDEDGRIKDPLYNTITVKTAKDFHEKVYYVLNEVLIPYMTINKNDIVTFTPQFVDDLRKNTDINENLKSLSELLGWKYGPRKIGNNSKNRKVMQVPFDEFLEFLFPDII